MSTTTPFVGLISPGNWVNADVFDGQLDIEALPGVHFYRQTGYVEITSTPATFWPIIIPDRRNREALPNTGLVVPTGRRIYRTAFNLAAALTLGAATDRIKIVTSAAGVPDYTSAIYAGDVASGSIVTAGFKNTSIPFSTAITALGADTTLVLAISNNAAAAAGTAISQTTTLRIPIAIFSLSYDDSRDLPLISQIFGGMP